MATTAPPLPAERPDADQAGAACRADHEHAVGGRRTRGPGRAPWLVLAGVLVGCVALALSGPGAGVLPPCPFRAMTGLDCPGCGMTRGVRDLLRGHPLAALGHNVLLAALVPVAVWGWLTWAGAPLPRLPRLSTRCGSALVAAVALFAVARNLPLPGCRWLASP